MRLNKYDGSIQPQVAWAMEQPQVIAPHEDQEIQLMLDGKKDFAVLELIKAPKQVQLALENGTKLNVRSTFNGEVSVSIRGHSASKHYKYIRLMADKAEWFKQVGGKKRFNTTMGRLFGYSEEEIEAFNESDVSKNCTCGKCN